MRIRIRRIEHGAERSQAEHLDALLDAALADSFPASDPVAIGHAGAPAENRPSLTANRDSDRNAPRTAVARSPSAPSVR